MIAEEAVQYAYDMILNAYDTTSKYSESQESV